MVFTIYGRGGHLGHVTRTIWTNFCSRVLRSLHMKFEFNWPSGFRGEDVWKCWRTTDGRRTDDGRRSHWYTNSSPPSLRLRWAKNWTVLLYSQELANSWLNLFLRLSAVCPLRIQRGTRSHTWLVSVSLSFYYWPTGSLVPALVLWPEIMIEHTQDKKIIYRGTYMSAHVLLS